MKRTARSQLILRTKLQAPQIKPGTLNRKRLITTIANSLDRKLLVITGDAGYGKTTLLAQVTAQSHLPGVFMSLDSDDSDFFSFFSCLVTGLEQLQPGLARRCKGLMKQGNDVGNNYQLAMGTLINEIVEKRKEELFVLVDDYHEISDHSEVHQAVDYFVDRLPPTVHMVLVSRREPPLPSMAKWRAKRDLGELPKESLRFTEQEIKALLDQSYGGGATEGDLRAIAEQTEGWITGIQLILQAAGREGKSIKEVLHTYLEKRDDLFRYFATEIFNRERQELRYFMRQCSVLEAMSAESCNYILKIKNAGAYLKELVQRNLFVSAYESGEYKYHRLFREFLHELISDPAQREILHKRAAEYFSRKGESEKAIQQYLWTNAYGPAIAEIKNIYKNMFIRAQFSRLSSWLELIPAGLVDGDPDLLMIRGKIMYIQGRIDEAEQTLDKAEAACQEQGSLKQKIDRTILTDIAYRRAQILVSRGDHARALAEINNALKICSFKDILYMGHLLVLFGVIRLNQVKLNEARQAFRSAIRFYRKGKHQRGVWAATSNLAIITEMQKGAREALEVLRAPLVQAGNAYFMGIGSLFYNGFSYAFSLGRWEEAERLLTKGWALCLPYHDDVSRSILELAWGKMDCLRGEWEEAMRHYDTALNGFRQLKRRRNECNVLIDIAQCLRHQKEYDQGRKVLDQVRERVSGIRGEIAYHIAKSMMAAADKRSDEAQAALAECAERMKQVDKNYRPVNYHLAQALCGINLGDERIAINQLTKAIQITQQQGCDGELAMELYHNPALQRLALRLKGQQKFLASLPRLPGRPKRELPGMGIKLFGRLELLMPEGRTLPLHMPSKKEASLFAYLLLHRDRPHPREGLIRMFWPGADRGSLNLNNQIYRLKKAINAAFVESGVKGAGKKVSLKLHEGYYHFSLGMAVKVDVEEFQELFRRASALDGKGESGESLQCWRECIELYQGQFLPKLEEHWAEELRENCRKSYRIAAGKVAAKMMEEQNILQAIDLYRRYINEDPYNEEIRAELWMALKALGRGDEITSDYQELCQKLKADLKVKPQVKTVEVYKKIK